MRKETLARQIKLGVVPPGTDLAPKPPGIQEWDELTADEKKVFARYMEIYAAFAEVTDYEIGRFLDEIEDLGEMDNTLIFYITGDNGSVFQGGLNGAFNELSVFNGLPEPLDVALKNFDEIGGPKSHILYQQRLGFRRRHALCVGPPGGLLRRRLPIHGGPLAEGHRGEGRPAYAVVPHDRHCSDGVGGSWCARA